MGVMNDIKETTRKVTNTVVDKTEDAVGITKSPKELAKRIVEHLNHREYREVGSMLSSEARKYLNKMGLKDNELAKEKLDDFDKAVKDLAFDLKDRSYQEITAKFEELEEMLPKESIKSSPYIVFCKKYINGYNRYF
ncbi:MAG: hypothetical protein K9G65_03600 [Rickettsiaceae bacterium]|nr:hypothetical protein [Rickettsiaceae bacterium]